MRRRSRSSVRLTSETIFRNACCDASNACVRSSILASRNSSACFCSVMSSMMTAAKPRLCDPSWMMPMLTRTQMTPPSLQTSRFSTRKDWFFSRMAICKCSRLSSLSSWCARSWIVRSSSSSSRNPVIWDSAALTRTKRPVAVSTFAMPTAALWKNPRKRASPLRSSCSDWWRAMARATRSAMPRASTTNSSVKGGLVFVPKERVPNNSSFAMRGWQTYAVMPSERTGSVSGSTEFCTSSTIIAWQDCATVPQTAWPNSMRRRS